jgi:hypothetical protein
MPKFINRALRSNVSGMDFSGATLLANMPPFTFFYLLLVLPFIPIPGGENARWENVLFWPVAAALTLTLVFRNWARIDRRFFHSLPIMSLIAYLVFAAASVT